MKLKNKLKKGTEVCFCPTVGSKVNGIVKAVYLNTNEAHVVYKCDGNWHDYENYTAELTDIDSLKVGWDSDAETSLTNRNIKI